MNRPKPLMLIILDGWGIDSGGLSWWSYTFSACALTGMGRTEEALDRLDELKKVLRASRACSTV